MRKTVLIFLTGLSLIGCGASKNLVPASKMTMLTTIDLVDVVDDRVKVSIDPGAFTSDKVSFFIPKTVPGTYSEDNYGKYIQNFRAIDYKGNELSVSKSDDNTWDITNGKNLDRVTYEVNDTYDTEGEVAEAVFSPAGTNILKGENFMLNLHGFIGYFDGLKEVPYQITISTPADLSATTSLAKKVTKAGVDIFEASRYFEVIDNPILYAKSSAESFEINGITVNLVLYSPNQVYKASDLKDRMQKMMDAQKSFLGEVNSTKQYNILLYLSTSGEDDASGFGALEHHTSTVVVLPEQMPLDRLEQAMVDVVSHEFFHIVTPLSVHSKEIQYFDFNNPKMSEHLWMYEGTTEYFANLFQIQQGLITETDFFKRIMDKINNAKRYDDDMSFTVMSKNILVAPYKENYANVYEKGTLINMALDITLRELSKGEKGVLWLLKELSKKYGDQVPFEDAALIGEITTMTYPEVGEFFKTHVIGNAPIDYSYYLSKVGLAITEVEQESGYFLNGDVPYIDVDQDNNNAIYVREGIALNTFFIDLGAKGADVIKAIDGVEISLETIRPIIGASFGWSPDKEIQMMVEREGQQLILTGTVGTPMVKLETIVPMDDATAEQVALRNVWMKG
ncbi:peptidase M61 [Sediminicola arcticus]|jgi:predicted metalloprotease with PDZ domain|uniref:Peptidase M61 n=1 Tax=Sediminicola arcticus TaxID=1574308 RepID=A0ABV2SS26_9FLAO